MEWIDHMQRGINYIETHLLEEISPKDAADAAFASEYHFSRIFYILTGYTVAEYIRNRRMSMALSDLLAGNCRVIDIALKYRYETPEAFTKAFRKIHGISPSKVVKGEHSYVFFSKITFQISVRGVMQMNYRIEEKENMRFTGIKRKFSIANGDNFKEIPLFWDEVMKDGTWEKMTGVWGPLGAVGICGDMDFGTEKFDYYIAVEENANSKGAFGDTIETGRQTWAIFECVGPLPGAIQNTFKRIYEEWFPSVAYEHEKAPELEVYLPGDPQSPNYRSEVWIPVKSK